MPRRVAVTGVGVVCAIGLNPSEVWQSLCTGRSGIGPLQSVPPGTVRFPNGAEVLCFKSENYFDPKDAGFLDRFAQYGVVAARQAIEDACIEWTPELKRSTAIVTGSCLGGKATEDEGYFQLYGQKNSRFNPLTIPRAMANAAASRISLEFGLTGPVYTISTACSSSNHALGNAFWLVRHGQVDVAIAGGSEAVFTPGVLHAWEAMRVVSPDTCRPFSKDRRGLILGDAGAMLVLENLEAARASMPRWSDLACLPMRTTLRSPRLMAPPSQCALRSLMPACFPKTSATSMRMAPARRPTIPPRRPPFAPCSVRMRTNCL